MVAMEDILKLIRMLLTPPTYVSIILILMQAIFRDMELLLQWEVAGLSEDAKQQEQLLMELPVPGQ